jgi:hypothetical protein
MVDRLREHWETDERDEAHAWAVEKQEPEDSPVDPGMAGWVSAFASLIEEASGIAQAKQLLMVQEQMSLLSKRIDELSAGNSIIVPILTFAPEPYVLLRDIRVVLEPSEDGFCATLYDANLSMCGETESEAIAALKAYIVDVFETLQRLPKLGPGPSMQLAVLRTLIAKAD